MTHIVLSAAQEDFFSSLTAAFGSSSLTFTHTVSVLSTYLTLHLSSVLHTVSLSAFVSTYTESCTKSVTYLTSVLTLSFSTGTYLTLLHPPSIPLSTISDTPSMSIAAMPATCA